ncbi:MAG: hypothetical protein GEU75_08890 [Dehalococcoidia bacterium]|nr:hypothetical protein [Dehalococcoidia bacterium]
MTSRTSGVSSRLLTWTMSCSRPISEVEADGRERGRRPLLDAGDVEAAMRLSCAANRSLSNTARSSRTRRPRSRALRNDL